MIGGMICEKFKNKREEHGFSQEDIAQKLNVSRQSFSKWIITKTCS